MITVPVLDLARAWNGQPAWASAPDPDGLQPGRLDSGDLGDAPSSGAFHCNGVDKGDPRRARLPDGTKPLAHDHGVGPEISKRRNLRLQGHLPRGGGPSSGELVAESPRVPFGRDGPRVLVAQCEIFQRMSVARIPGRRKGLDQASES